MTPETTVCCRRRSSSICGTHWRCDRSPDATGRRRCASKSCLEACRLFSERTSDQIQRDEKSSSCAEVWLEVGSSWGHTMQKANGRGNMNPSQMGGLKTRSTAHEVEKTLLTTRTLQGALWNWKSALQSLNGIYFEHSGKVQSGGLLSIDTPNACYPQSSNNTIIFNRYLEIPDTDLL